MIPPQTRHIVVVTGASGAGKTAAIQALDARRLTDVRCFHFDSIGVPSDDVMERDFGGGDRWQAFATAAWVSRLDALGADALRLPIVDTSRLSVDEVADALESIVRSLPR